MTDQLYFLHHAFQVEILSFVLMSNHFHLLARFPLANISAALNYFMRETSRRIGAEAGRINQTYGGRFHRCLIKSYHYYLNAYKYVYRNPVEAGICGLPIEYPYSTLPALLGQAKTIVPVQEDLTLFSDLVGTMRWLDRTPTPESYERMRKALRHPVMKFATDSSGSPNPLEFELY